MSLNPYQVLGVSRTDDETTIKKAYKNLARKYHPDVTKEADAEVKFTQINAAWDILKDAGKRKMYDTYGRADGPPPGAGFGGQGGPAGQGGFSGFGQDTGVNMDDLLSSMFGAGASRGGFGRNAKGRDQRTTLRLDFMLAVTGGETTIVIPRPGGSRDTLKVRIPAGVETGKSLRLRGRGQPAPGGGPAGDLHIELQVGSHRSLRRNGANLEMDLPITIGEAVNGATVVAPTPTGDVKVKVPAGASNGTKLRLKGRGVQIKNKPGDLHLILRPTLPSVTTDEQRAAVEVLEQAYDESVRDNLKL